jgi:glycosyltransferase involved in cell wall biosynthesis
MFAYLVRVAEGIATKCSEKVISVTPSIASYLQEEFHCPADKIAVVGNGVDTKKFYPNIESGQMAKLKNQLGIASDDQVIVFVGNLARWQGVESLIDAALLVLTKGGRAKFLIVGDGALKAELERKVSKTGYGKSIVFTGMVDYGTVPSFINLADICVAPFILKRNEKTGVSPLKVFEYMACGKPVVASRVEGLEFVEREDIGKLTIPEDPVSLEEAIMFLLGHDGLRANMGRRGLQIAREKFEWESRATEIEAVLKTLA